MKTTTRPHASVARVAAAKDAWARRGPAERVALLDRCIPLLHEVAPAWVEAACAVQGLDPESSEAGEVWLSGPVVALQGFRMVRHSLRHGGAPPLPPTRSGPDGRRIVRVFPHGLYDRLLYPGTTVDVWLGPGQPVSQGRAYREETAGRVAFVLGAGNIGAIAPLDVLHKLFVENQVVVLKVHPVNAYLAPLLERALAPLVEVDALAVVTGDVETGARIVADDRVDTLHLTGSTATYDAIVWGTDPAGREQRRRAGTPLVGKPFSAELGSVTPVLVVPGPWRDRDLRFQARNVAGMVAHNASFNCNAAKVLVLWNGWDRREAFVREVRAALAALAPRKAYYPGAFERYRAFLDRYPHAEAVGPAAEGAIPWTWIGDVPEREGEYALTHEAFCGVLAETSLGGRDPAEFLDRAIAFANERVGGSLSCVVLAHPASRRRDPARFDRAIERLRYGAIAINAWSGLAFGLAVATWGAYPGNRPEEIGSGSGTVHNALMIDDPERSVLRSPFRLWPKPPWFADHRTLHVLGRRLASFERSPAWWKLPGLFSAALRG